MSKHLRIACLPLLAALALFGAGVAQAASHNVQISRATFTPKTVTVAPGDSVVWTNADDVDHQVVSNSGSFASSPVLHPGQTYTLAFAASGNYGYHDGYYLSHTGTVAVSGGAPQVLIRSGGFSPYTETIEPGTTVVWKNTDTQSHQVIAKDGSFSSPVLTAGQSYSRQFTTSGTVNYRDGFYPSHTGQVKVLPPLPPAPPAADVAVWGNGFVPATDNVTVGTTVTWYNADRYNHQVVADDSSFKSPVLTPGQTYSFKFTISGRYGYRDGLHTAHRGTVDVAASVTLMSSQPTLVYGQSVTLTGTVSSGKVGETVLLFANPNGSASPTQQVAQAVTTTGGAFSFAVTPSQNTSYSAQWNNKVSQTVSVTVSPHLTFLPVQGTSYKSYRVTCAPAAACAGKLVHLAKLVNGQWTSIATLRLGADGTKTFKRPKFAGVYHLSIDTSQTGSNYAAGNSGSQHFRINAR